MLPPPSFLDALGEVEQLGAAAAEILADRRLTANEIGLALVQLAGIATQATFPEAARHAVWISASPWLYGLEERCPACGQLLALSVDREAILRWAAIDDARRRDGERAR